MPHRPAASVVTTALALLLAAAAPAAAAPSPQTPKADKSLPADTRFYVDPAGDAAKQAVTDLAHGDLAGAADMARLASGPEATWVTGGTPAEVQGKVAALMRSARRTGTVPVLVAYNIPGRDCSLYSAGGAESDAAYQAWIKGFAQGIGDRKAVVVLEPDGLANLPSDCGPDTDPTGALTAGRITDLNAAVDALAAQAATSVYLDAGNSHWRPVGDMADRLLKAGVERTQGFSLDVSNYLAADDTNHYGTWVSQCLWFATKGPDWARGHADWCASQYYSPAAPNDGRPGSAVDVDDPGTWHWTDQWFQQNAGTPPTGELTHFVQDTSRNGRGTWNPPAGT